MIRMLDTNAYSAWRRGEPRVSGLVQEAERLSFSAIVAGELLHGFRNGTRYHKNRRELEDLLDQPEVTFVPVGRVTAERYAQVVTQLRRKGRPIPTNDIWIAAQALETGSELVSFDRHFESVDGLAWTDPRDVSDGYSATGNEGR